MKQRPYVVQSFLSCTDRVGVGCEGDGEAYCDLQCRHGYQMDSNGCTLCACMSPPDCPELTNCGKICPHVSAELLFFFLSKMSALQLFLVCL